MKYLVVLALLIGSIAKADSITLNWAGATYSAPSYGVSLEHDWRYTYMSLGSSVSGDKQSSSTSLAYGLSLLETFSLGGFIGEKLDNGSIGGQWGGEFNIDVPLNDKFFIEEDNRIIRSAGSSNTAVSVGLGISMRL